mmetsp:Transcript_34708/g.79549  ORF Transcript_34708/g.79549 Transcript_34708/m.79549 type:complete len:220 (-) Transcript_34708:104-763(-)
MADPKIAAMLQADGRYEQAILPDLEAYVEKQLSDGVYDLDANLATLKLYLLHPDTSKVEVVEGILLKALMAFPKTDFSLCMYQIPEAHHTALKDVIKVAQQLEMCKFKAFWKDAEGEDVVKVLNRAKGWQASVRKFICGVVTSTYRSISRSSLADLLNVKSEGLKEFLEANKWTASKDDKETIIVNSASFKSAHTEKKSGPQVMSLDQYRSLFTASTSA